MLPIDPNQTDRNQERPNATGMAGMAALLIVRFGEFELQLLSGQTFAAGRLYDVDLSAEAMEFRSRGAAAVRMTADR